MLAEISLSKDVYNVAVRYLARRDYSRHELLQKLAAKAFGKTEIEHVLDHLAEHGYQSDERFTEMYIRTRLNAGDGPFKIKIALRQKGICDSLALAVIDRMGVDWLEQAQRLKERRFGETTHQTPSDLAKQQRYFRNKGYYQEHISQTLMVNAE